MTTFYSWGIDLRVGSKSRREHKSWGVHSHTEIHRAKVITVATWAFCNTKDPFTITAKYLPQNRQNKPKKHSNECLRARQEKIWCIITLKLCIFSTRREDYSIFEVSDSFLLIICIGLWMKWEGGMNLWAITWWQISLRKFLKGGPPMNSKGSIITWGSHNKKS